MTQPLAVLATDVVDSTLLQETVGEHAMASLWKAHDVAARDLMRTWNGQEIARSDGFLILFKTVPDSLSFAAAYHQVLLSFGRPLFARVGVHWGLISIRENELADRSRGAPLVEVDGAAVPLAFRVMSVAQGGQTLITSAAEQELRFSSERCSSYGHWQLKGVPGPVELFSPHPSCEPPPDSEKAYRVVFKDGIWEPRTKIANTIPTERDTFVGRTAQLQDIASRFQRGTRLLSVLGPGGAGKTRFAIRFARTWLGDFPGGIWFCDLSQGRSLEGLVHAVAHGLEVPLGSADPVEQLGRAISGRGRCLVILDNFEQLVAYARLTLEKWVRNAGEARFLVTTREVLGLSG